ncbi:hypothetical protein HQ590_07470 [bacterium]|nr:hypothetical protein [bacterium]
MDTIRDFEDMLLVLARQRVRYLIIGGLAFIYHAKPRYTKDMNLWVDPAGANLVRANRALAEFGSPVLFAPRRHDQILQVGIAPNRVDLILAVEGVRFSTAWSKRIRGRYGQAPANWLARQPPASKAPPRRSPPPRRCARAAPGAAAPAARATEIVPQVMIGNCFPGLGCRTARGRLFI